MADITHTLGIDESEFVRGLKRAEDQAKGMGRGLQDATASVKSMQEGFQRVQGLVLGTSAAIGAIGLGAAKIVSGIDRFLNAGEGVQRELEAHRQISIELSTQLTAHQRITREIEDRYQDSLRRIGERDRSAGGILERGGDRVADIVQRGAPSDIEAVGRFSPFELGKRFAQDVARPRATALETVTRDFVESQAAGARRAADAARAEEAALQAARLRAQVEGDIATMRARQAGDLTARAEAETREHRSRIQRIQEIDGLDSKRVEELIKLEQQRFAAATQSIDAEQSARARLAESNRAKEQQAAEQRRAADEESISRSLEDLRISNLRAEGKDREARQAEIAARFEQQRLAIERSTASEGFKRASLDKLTEERMSALALAGRPEDARLGTRGVGTGLGAQATRQALGVGPGRSIERTTTGIAVDLRKAVEILNKMSSAAPIARLA